MRSFASDNYSGVCQEVFDALYEANHDHAPSYGNDAYTQKALDLLKGEFGESVISFFVYNGTAANVLGLSAVLKSYYGLICADSAHIVTQEVGALIKSSGCKLLLVPNYHGKLTLNSIEEAYKKESYWGRHSNKPKVVSISQTTEYGTIYTPEELKAISAVCKQHDMLLHMDGCRLANAAVALNAPLKAISFDAGIDILSFGGAKNGLMFGEVIMFRDESLARDFEYIQKQSLQLHSKHRFLAVQFIPYLEKKLWHCNASHANTMCQRLAAGLARCPDIKFAHPVESNQIFAHFPQQIIDVTQAAYPYYIWNQQLNLVRLITSFDTTEADVDQFIELANEGKVNTNLKP